MIFAVSCSLLDNKTEVARKAVKKKYENLRVKLSAHMIDFTKTNGESFESKVLFEPGMHKIYKLYYTAEFKAGISGFILEDKTGSAFPRIFNKDEISSNFDIGQRWGYYQKRTLKENESFYIKSYVLLRQKENGWEQIDE